jgi:DNA (cytosine-5)-methyltransferase 1
MRTNRPARHPEYDLAVSSAFTAIDLFSGAGGASRGLRDAGYVVQAAVENDPCAVETFRANHPKTQMFDRDVRRVHAPVLARSLRASGTRVVDLLTACPPCQPFSTLGSGDPEDRRNRLVSSLARFVRHLRPRAVLLENVPGLQCEPRFARLVAELETDYRVRQYVVQAADFGVPQKRRRVIVLGIERTASVEPPADLRDALPASFDASPRTAGEALVAAETLTADLDPVHRARTPQPKTLERIRAVAQGGGRGELPEHLRLDCHVRLGRRHATSIYGRIDPGHPAPTMTTRCTTPSCGRFIHPTEDRGLTLREAALIQTFPLDYKFFGSYESIERQIGNAVPPRLARALGLIVAELLSSGKSSRSRGQAA